ncbi:MAG: hypothetical protein Q9163_005207 [Psora crenata]
MTELTFAKQFLSTLDARPIKLQADHVSNPKALEIHSPYTLPRMPNPMKKPSNASSSSSSKSKAIIATIILKSSRNPPLELKLPGMDAGTTSILELKERVAKEIGMDGIGKIKVLWEKKPVSDAKTVQEVIGERIGGQGEVEFGVMVMGYTAQASAEEASKVGSEGQKEVEEELKAVDDAGGDDMLSGEQFWNDLKGFLHQRLKDEGQADDAFAVFRNAWIQR